MDQGLESIRGFATRVGRSHPTIIQAIKDGRITAVKRDRDSGRVLGIHWELALIEYASNTDPTQAERTAAPLNTAPAALVPPAAAKGAGAGPGGDSGADDDPLAPVARDADHGYLEHRARTEEFRSKQGELDYLKNRGELVSAAAVTEAAARRYRTQRDKWLNIPDRVATTLAAERDPARVHQLLTDEIKRVLSDLSTDATREAAAGGAA